MNKTIMMIARIKKERGTVLILTGNEAAEKMWKKMFPKHKVININSEEELEKLRGLKP